MEIRPRTRLTLVAAAALALAAPRGAAGQSAACPAAGDSARADSARADVVIVASVSAREVRFDRAPNARLGILGCDTGGLRVLERRNLPDRIEPGVTYRDVYVSVRILGALNAACIAALAGDTAAARQVGGAGACLPARASASSAPP